MLEHIEVNVTFHRTYRAWFPCEGKNIEQVKDELNSNLDSSKYIAKKWTPVENSIDLEFKDIVDYKAIKENEVIINALFEVKAIKESPISFYEALTNIDNYGGIACNEGKVLFKPEEDVTVIAYIGSYLDGYGDPIDYEECTLNSDDIQKPWFHFATIESAKKWFTRSRDKV